MIVVNVRRGVYEDSVGNLHTGWLHDHPCVMPGCDRVIPCEAQPVLEHDADWMPCSRWGCDEDIDWLCDTHRGAVRCDYCDEFGHDCDHCPSAVNTEAGLTRADFEEQEADAAYAVEKDSR